MLHGLVAAFIVGWAFFFPHRGSNWGENASNVGAIQATMVSSIPLPPTQRTLDTGVLTSEAPSPAPVTEKEKTEAAPTPYSVWWYLTPELWLALAAGVIGSTPWVPALAARIDDGRGWSVPLVNTAALVALLLLSIMSMAARTYNPFIYFRF